MAPWPCASSGQAAAGHWHSPLDIGCFQQLAWAPTRSLGANRGSLRPLGWLGAALPASCLPCTSLQARLQAGRLAALANRVHGNVSHAASVQFRSGHSCSRSTEACRGHRSGRAVCAFGTGGSNTGGASGSSSGSGCGTSGSKGSARSVCACATSAPDSARVASGAAASTSAPDSLLAAEIRRAEGGADASVPAERQLQRRESSGGGSRGSDWSELLSTPEPELFGGRARSASDAAVLRRKGHLKEQDAFIDFLLGMHATHTSAEAMAKMEGWITQHRQDPRHSRLKRMVPTVGSFFTPLRLTEAFNEYDEFFALSRRKYVPPNFAEIRHILNIAQVHSSAESLKLITFDADGTLYADGAHMEQDNEMVSHIVSLLRQNVHVAIVTAAGYPGEADRFEQRIAGLLDAFRRLRLPPAITDRFFIMGGECNYLLKAVGPEQRLRFVPDDQWKSATMLAWRAADIQQLLDEAQALLQDTARRLRLPVKVLRKERAVGVLPQAPTIYEVLEELAITVQARLGQSTTLPFCAFNGGADVFVDLGNKSLGLEALMNFLGFKPHQVLHVGDRFTESGNDSATRDCCSILWVANPEETDFFIKLLLADIRKYKLQPYIE